MTRPGDPPVFSWFDIAWPWIGVVAALVLLVVLFGSNFGRSSTSRSRWRDPVWLSWLAVPVYMIHQFEEYGVALTGFHRFPDALCGQFNYTGYPECPIPPLFYLAVNIPLIWVMAPLVALVSRRYPLVGLSVYGVIFVNAIVHTVPALLGKGYGPGLMTSLLIMFPLSGWVFVALFGPGRWPRRLAIWVVAGGMLVHGVLLGSVWLFVTGRLSAPALSAVQVGNAFVIPLLLWGVSRVSRVPAI